MAVIEGCFNCHLCYREDRDCYVPEFRREDLIKSVILIWMRS